MSTAQDQIEQDRRLIEAAGFVLACEKPLRKVVEDAYLRVLMGWMDREYTTTMWLRGRLYD